ncbi:MAG: hypothetical protein SGJ19_18725 [Planctomycetia bacterium]|nr:hypothetical protein [Planctomycetia bacterium]
MKTQNVKMFSGANGTQSRVGMKLLRIGIDLAMLGLVAVMSAISGHFLAEVLALFAFVIYVASCVLRPRNQYSGWVPTLLSAGVVISVLLPADIALRDGAHWSAKVVKVENSSTPECEQSFEVLRYRTEFVRVRWAFVFIIPIPRYVYTPLFVHPRAPFLIGAQREQQRDTAKPRP